MSLLTSRSTLQHDYPCGCQRLEQICFACSLCEVVKCACESYMKKYCSKHMQKLKKIRAINPHFRFTHLLEIEHYR